MSLQAIFFDVGDTLLVDEPNVEERLWMASQACELDYPRHLLTPAVRSLETFLLAHYLEGRTPEQPGMIAPTVRHLMADLGLPEPDGYAIGRFAAAYLAVPYVRRLDPGAVGLLSELRRRGWALGIISDWDAALETMLHEMGVGPLVDAFSVSEIVGATKPSADLFRDALGKLKVAPDQALHIGDFYELDVAGARAAGMQALLFDWRSRCPGGDCERVHTFDELAAYCLALPAPEVAQ